jgi:hypothetical protein
VEEEVAGGLKKLGFELNADPGSLEQYIRSARRFDDVVRQTGADSNVLTSDA